MNAVYVTMLAVAFVAIAFLLSYIEERTENRNNKPHGRKERA